jgi:hypothetical protein
MVGDRSCAHFVFNSTSLQLTQAYSSQSGKAAILALGREFCPCSKSFVRRHTFYGIDIEFIEDVIDRLGEAQVAAMSEKMLRG